ncbi:GNAT family protein [Brevundimonas sp. 2R-24]|uniref:GNAT family protein n=1 Tax=Peiella sedimenti TaxID=3061083 RepID=A0ABT8SK83_9CAUL|nr:GNAT family protein [Caulobacteraceae bacterium XZ-24]
MDLPYTAVEGRHVRLEPFSADNREAVRQAINCDPETWNIYGTNGYGEAFSAWWDAALIDLAKGVRHPYAILDARTGEGLGTSSFHQIDPAHRSVEIGYTFLALQARGGPVNPESKRLMLERAFAAGALRVFFQVDARNQRSQAAVAKLGAVREGVLRKHKVTWTGHHRDTVVFSITDEDWPGVRDRLNARLAALS